MKFSIRELTCSSYRKTRTRNSSFLCYVALFVLAAADPLAASAQSADMQRKNLAYVDSVRQVVEKYMCQVPQYPDHYDSAQILEAESLIKDLNLLTADGVTERLVHLAFNPKRYTKIQLDTASNGLSRIVSIHIYQEYDYTELQLMYVDSFLISMRISLTTIPRLSCYHDNGGFSDFHLLNNVYARELNFPLWLVDMKKLVLRLTKRNNLQKIVVRFPAVNLFANYLVDSGNTFAGRFISNMYNPDSNCCYSFERPEKHLVRLIQEGRYDLIRDIVFGPNYLYAINAMEALLYLQSKGKVTIDERTNQHINELKNAIYPVSLENLGDVVTRPPGNEAIKKSKLDKYKQVLPD